MAVSVERLYRVTIGDAAHLLGGEESLDQVKALLTALGIEPLHADRTALHVEETDGTAITAGIAPPAQLPSGPVAEEAAPVEVPAPIVEESPPTEPASPPAAAKDETSEKPARWGQADTDRLRALAAGGLSLTQIARAMDRPYHTVAYRASKHAIALCGGAHGKRTEQPGPEGDPQPPVAPASGTPVAPLLDRPSDWSVPETKALIREMGAGGGGFKAAAEKTRHGMGSCALRWKHLKEAGIMTVERYMSSPEAQA